MSDPVSLVLERNRGRELLVDTNILLLYFVGVCDRRLIASFKSTQQFDPEDFDLFVRLFDSFGAIVTTPNVLTEINSLAGQLSGSRLRTWRVVFRAAIAQCDEHYLPSRLLVDHSAFLDVGLTDAGLMEMSKGRLTLTDDLRLYVALRSVGLDAINFNHIRELNWS